jgi:hypothetical protein
MEFEESKKALIKKSSLYRDQLEGEAKLLSDRAEKILTNALVIGGALALSYIVVSQFSKSSKRKSKGKGKTIKLVSAPAAEEFEQEPAQGSGITRVATEIGTAIASQATAFLLSIAREKLMEFLQSKIEKKSPNNEHS